MSANAMFYLHAPAAAAEQRPAEPRPRAGVDSRSLLTQMGGEVSAALSSALERVSSLAATGTIDRQGLWQLREEIERARRSAEQAQHLVRLARHPVPPVPERVDLDTVMREALRLRERESRSRGLQFKHCAEALPVQADPALLFALVETTLDWVYEHAHGRFVVRLDRKGEPARGRLTISLLRRHDSARAAADDRAGEWDAGLDPQLSTVAWHLLEQLARVMGLAVSRRDSPTRSELRVLLPQLLPLETATTPRLGLATLETTELPSSNWSEQPLAGRHIVALCAHRGLRSAVREALRPSGALIDFVSTLDEAKRSLEDALPHAVICEAALAGPHFHRLRSTLQREAPQLVFIELTEGGPAFALRDDGTAPYACVCSDALADSLPAALMFELARQT